MSITFGVDTLCRFCSKTTQADCRHCRGTGLTSGPQAPVRRESPDTSVAAAASVKGIRSSQELILTLLRHFGPMTDETIWAELRASHGRDMSPSGARTRRSELVGRGLVEACGTEILKSGRRATIWRAVQ